MVDQDLALRPCACGDGADGRARGHESEVITRAEELGPSHATEVFRLTWHGLRADRQWCADFLERLEASRRHERMGTASDG